MSSGQQPAAGPDLTMGIPLRALDETGSVLGHVGDDAVLLIRSGDEVFAISAACTHYGGPLEEGLIVGETIRCPWHHACFSIRTGAVVAAPALKPLARWRTVVRDGQVRVTTREPETGNAVARVRSDAAPMVVIGAGAAGHAAVETLRREGHGGRIVVIDPDVAAPYDRPNLSKDYLAGDAPEDWLPLRPQSFYAEQGIERIVAAATSLDPVKRAVTLADGRVLKYGSLLLATGAAAVRPRIVGVDRSHVHVLRSLDDCRAIINAAIGARRVVIAGASFIGMEAAASLRNWGLEITVVAPERIPFQKTLGKEIGRALRKLHEERDVRFQLGRTIGEIGASDVLLDDGSRVEADLVLLGVGVRPCVDLAGAAGLVVDDGVVVDDRLQTSSAGIFAAGDSARYPNPRTGELMRVEHWVVAQRQGQTAARNMLGAAEAFTAVPFFWTRQYDVTINYVGYAPRWTHVDVEGNPAAGDCRVTYRKGTETLAVATIGRDRESLNAERAFERLSTAKTLSAMSLDGPAC